MGLLHPGEQDALLLVCQACGHHLQVQYVHACMHGSVCLFVCGVVCLFVYVYMHVRMCVYMYVCVHVRMYIATHTYVHTLYVCMFYMYVCSLYMYVRTCMHAGVPGAYKPCSYFYQILPNTADTKAVGYNVKIGYSVQGIVAEVKDRVVIWLVCWEPLRI